MRLALVLVNLELRNPDGSLAWEGYWTMGVGGLMVLGGLANIAGRLPRRWLPPRVPRWVQVGWGAIGLGAGVGFILGEFEELLNRTIQSASAQPSVPEDHPG